MNINQNNVTEWFLRISLSAGFLSAVADRFGFWPHETSAWGSWESFVSYTDKLIPFAPSVFGAVATLLEVVLAVLLLIPYKTFWVARISGALLLAFALAMTFSSNIKTPLDYSVYTASAAAFGLSILVAREINAQKTI